MTSTEKRFFNEKSTVISQEMIFAKTQLFLTYNKLIARRRNHDKENRTVEEYKNGLIALIELPFRDSDAKKSQMEDACAGKECEQILKFLFGK